MTIQNKTAYFLFSFDFELMFGVIDKRSINEYRQNIEGVWEVVPLVLDLFKRYNIHCTWGTVGFLFCHDKEDLINMSPPTLPVYTDQNLSTYNHINQVTKENSSLFFARDLISMIKETPGQEIGSHTFSHFYNAESENDIDFINDIRAVTDLGNRENIRFTSMIFPRNQYKEMNIDVLSKYGFTSFRGLETVFENTKFSNKMLRFYRYFDSYFNLSGYNCYNLDTFLNLPSPYNFKSSYFLRAYRPNPILEYLRIARAKAILKYAANNHLICHFWSHPHNFGECPQKSVRQLERIIKYYSLLSQKYNIKSVSMSELVDIINKTKMGQTPSPD